ncbi:4a-hydroxytetrahydrobiopterin dehydratase [Nocardioides sp. SYSU D00038]|uniref:4a-hydroxytetrahydrobiopterin dehydratase n=1 Tax=Nocardioides sp. SYSU D00038 TaxID=2812554 RepID=UPI001968189C|nr:4a-hydroxytetrahydrobiopterin dehydratase [Nocardioides sp. SYSU D00038]
MSSEPEQEQPDQEQPDQEGSDQPQSDQEGSDQRQSDQPQPDHPQPDDRTPLDGHAIEAELLDDWRPLLGTLQARFVTGDFATGLRLANDVGALAEAADHHPDLDLRYRHLDVRLVSHDVRGITMRDIRLAREISDAAGRLGAKGATEELSVLELALDTWDHAEVKPFWKALLGLADSDSGDDELTDPTGRLPTIWFQPTERPVGADADGGGATVPQRWHLDVRVPPEQAEGRIRDALAAGGTLVSDARAPRFWVLADPQGNQACITTWLGRGFA